MVDQARSWSLSRTEVEAADTDTYTLDVVAIDVADAVLGAGGLMFDRRHSGWTVRVFVFGTPDIGPLQILGAQGFSDDAVRSFTAIPPHTALAMSSAAAARSSLLCPDVWARWRRKSAEVILWGETPRELSGHMVRMEHRLSGAGHAFKTRAWLACGRDAVLPHDERFHGTGRICTPLNPDLTTVALDADDDIARLGTT